MNYDYWDMLPNGTEDLVTYWEMDRDPGQDFDTWLDQMFRAGIIRRGNDGNIYIAI